MRGQSHRTRFKSTPVSVRERAERRDALAIEPGDVGTDLLGARLLSVVRTASALHAQATDHAAREGETG